MKLNFTIDLNLKTKEVTKASLKAAREGMRDTVILIMNDAKKDTPFQYGTNQSSIASEASGFPGGEGVVDQHKIEGAVYSTSGYGGYLESGTKYTKPRPYIKPAFDRHQSKFPKLMKEHLERA